MNFSNLHSFRLNSAEYMYGYANIKSHLSIGFTVVSSGRLQTILSNASCELTTSIPFCGSLAITANQVMQKLVMSQDPVYLLL